MTDACGCARESDQSPVVKAPERIGREAQPVCPVCGGQSRKVPGQTVKALLAVSLRGVQDGEYRFCPNPSCEAVYFTAGGESVFTRGQIRERVYQKEPNDDDVLVCYCFRFTRGEIAGAAREEQARITAEINAGVQAGQCACDLRNPQGSCCLGNVHSLIRQSG